TKLTVGLVVTNGGRVLNVCAIGNSLEEARNKVYKASEKINFEGKYFRKDIGLA
ncbi:MAG: phosphoribosylamine--glycine ligase, partial [Bacilli bacterium]|nr:phosphoribosylamine--glycine ligase [Bacilli bacterium]